MQTARPSWCSMSDFPDSTELWCDKHAVPRGKCACPWSGTDAGLHLVPDVVTDVTDVTHGRDKEGADSNGAELLDDIEEMLAKFVAFPNDHALVATALWACYTHALDASDTSPRIAFLSPEPGSGKTRALEILEMLVPRPLLTVNVTPAYLFRKVSDEAGPPTILFDEIDTVFGPRAKDNEEIRGLLNSGYRKGAVSGRCVVGNGPITTEDMPSFAACALAGLDDLPDTIMSRAIVIRMRRRAPNEHIQAFRRRTHSVAGQALNDRISAWITSVWADLDGAWPDLPAGIEDRNADVWEPLLAIADAAGGHWPERARESAVAFVTDAATSQGGFGLQLLADIRTAFGDALSMATDVLIEALITMDESPWADIRGKALDARGLSRRLSKYGIKPKVIRFGDTTGRGYERADLHDAWVRYLPDLIVTDVTHVTDVRIKEGAKLHINQIILTSDKTTHREYETQEAADVRALSEECVTSVTSVTSALPDTTPHNETDSGPSQCQTCDTPLLLNNGRTQCERCRLDALVIDELDGQMMERITP